MSEKARLRKYEDDLNVSGTAVVVLGAWSIVKVFIQAFLGTRDSIELDKEDLITRVLAVLAVIAIMAIISFIIMKIHLYIGLNAMRAAKGKEHKKGYFVGAVIILILSILSLITYKEKFRDLENIDTTIASIIVDLTTIYIFAIVIISSLKIKELKVPETKG